MTDKTAHDESYETAADLARRLKASERTIRRYAEAGILPSIKIGHLVRFDRRDVDAVLAAARIRRSA